MKAIIQAVKGTRDFYPEERGIHTWLYQAIRKVSESFGYQEYDGAYLEKLELYIAKSGEELVKENFVLEDRSGEKITLRPELTPTLARMIAQRQGELTLPVRWWSFGPFWRYEKPQKGRAREFFQWNIDLIGVDSPEADAEIVAIGANFFKSVGLSPKEISIRVNNRGLMDGELLATGIPAELKLGVFKLIDRRDKMSAADWEIYALDKVGLSALQLEALKLLLEDHLLWQKSPGMVRFFKAVECLGVSDYVVFDPQVIRGLDYYTGTVFEARDQDGEFRAIFGGGRYDKLVDDVGGDPMAAVGFAMGDMVITLVLEKYGHLPKLAACPAQVLVTVFDDGCMPASLEVSAALRQAGMAVITYAEPVKLPKQLKFADKMGIQVVVIIGPDEAAARQVTVKNLAQRTQQTVPQEQAATTIRQILAGANPS
jgi:histidyl-tRNA synthetase